MATLTDQDSFSCFLLLLIGLGGILVLSGSTSNLGFLKNSELEDTFKFYPAIIPTIVVSSLLISLMCTCYPSTFIESNKLRQTYFGGVGAVVIVLCIGLLATLAGPVQSRRPWEQASDLENLENSDVQEAISFSLALFSVCCFDPANATDIPPDLSCEAKNFTQPCLTNETLFDDFTDLIDFDSDLCSVTLPEKQNGAFVLSPKRRRYSVGVRPGRPTRPRRFLQDSEEEDEPKILNGDFLCNQGEDAYVEAVATAVAFLMTGIVFTTGVCSGLVCGCGGMLIFGAVDSHRKAKEEEDSEAEEKGHPVDGPAVPDKQL